MALSTASSNSIGPGMRSVACDIFGDDDVEEAGVGGGGGGGVVRDEGVEEEAGVEMCLDSSARRAAAGAEEGSFARVRVDAMRRVRGFAEGNSGLST